MLFEAGKRAGAPAESDDATPFWHAQSPEAAIARIAAGYTTVALSPDGFSRPHSLSAFAAFARTHDDSLVFAAFGEGRSQWILPLRIERSLGICQAVPLAAPLGQYAPEPPCPVEADTLRRLAEWLRADHGCDLLLLRRVRQTSPLAALLEAAGAVVSQQDEALFIDLAAIGSFDAYLQSFSAKKRANWRRDLRRLEDEGHISFEVWSNGEAEKILRRAIEWKRAWLDDVGIASPVIHDQDWCDVLIACAAGNGHVSILALDGRPVAVELGFDEAGSYAAYLGAFDPAFGRLSVGQEQMRRTIEWCFAQGFSRYDLLPPADDYKRHWCRGSTGIAVADYALPLSMAGRAASFAHGRLRPLARRLVHSTPAPMRRLLLGR